MMSNKADAAWASLSCVCVCVCACVRARTRSQPTGGAFASAAWTAVELALVPDAGGHGYCCGLHHRNFGLDHAIRLASFASTLALRQVTGRPPGVGDVAVLAAWCHLLLVPTAVMCVGDAGTGLDARLVLLTGHQRVWLLLQHTRFD